MIKHRLIGVYQLITGITGILLILFRVDLVIQNREVFFTFFLGIALYAGLTYLGYALIKNKNHAINYSIVIQLLQSISFIYNGKQYLFTAAAFMSVLYKIPANISLSYQPRIVDYNISEISRAIPFELSIYILPVIFVLLLLIKK
jgi:hypothetical protein